MLEQFSATIDKLYAAAADPNLWEEALRAVEDYTGSTGAVLNLVPKSPDAKPLVLAGSFSRSDCADYANNYMWRCPRIAFAQANPDIPIHFDRLILTESEMDRDATYEWYGQHGLRYFVAGWLGESGTHRAYMSLQRSRRQGHVEPEQVDQFSLIQTHMARALSLAVKLGTFDQQARFGLNLLDSLPNAVFALAADGRVLLTNGLADRLLNRGDGLVCPNGRLRCRIESQQSLLERLIGDASSTDLATTRGGWIRIQRASGRRPYVAVIGPLKSPANIFGAFRAKVLVVVSDSGEAASPSEEALHEIFGLTEAEGRLAIALCGGHSLESAAVVLHVQPSTARAHLKAVFRKVGVNRQQDLVRLLTSLSTAAPTI